MVKIWVPPFWPSRYPPFQEHIQTIPTFSKGVPTFSNLLYFTYKITSSPLFVGNDISQGSSTSSRAYLCGENVGTTYSPQTIPTFSKSKPNDTRAFKVNPPFHNQSGYFSSTREIAEPTRSVTGVGGLSNADYLQTLSEERCGRKKDRNVAYNSRLKGLVSDLKGTDKCLPICAKSTGTWMIVHSNTVSGTVLSAT